MSDSGVKTSSPDFSIRRECNSVGAADNGKELQVCGWVYRYRDQGGVLFVDLRDRSGVVQVVFDLAVNADLHKHANALRGEDVILIEGKVRLRDKNAINPKLKTGEIEIVAEKLEPLPLGATTRSRDFR